MTLERHLQPFSSCAYICAVTPLKTQGPPEKPPHPREGEQAQKSEWGGEGETQHMVLEEDRIRPVMEALPGGALD